MFTIHVHATPSGEPRVTRHRTLADALWSGRRESQRAAVVLCFAADRLVASWRTRSVA